VKILAMEIEMEGVESEQFMPYLKLEAQRVWELYQNGTIREFYFREERSEAVLMLECADASEACQRLESLPLVKAGLITFDIIPLVPYPGIAWLFGELDAD
jgi:hypothetical protein